MNGQIHLEPGEHIIVKVRKHWIILVRDTMGTVAVGLLPFILAAALVLTGHAALIPNTLLPVLSFASAVWLLTIWMALALIVTDYYLDIWIVTERRVYNIEQQGLFERQVATWSMDRIQEITVRTSNVVETLFGYGTIQVETAGPTDANAIAHGIPHPERIRAVILKQIGHIGELEETTKKQEGLIHMIGHEVKGYLTKDAAAFSNIAETDPVPPVIKHVAEDALVETRKGVSTVMNILDSADPHNGTVLLATTRFNVATTLRTAVDFLRRDAEKRGLLLTCDSADAYVNGDEVKLREIVFRNLIDNAIRYTQKGSIDVRGLITGGFIQIHVTDTGAGISSEDMTRLFTEGGAGTNAKSLNPESTGFGLFLAKQIVEAHRGRIWAESKGAGQGATFIVELPLTA